MYIYMYVYIYIYIYVYIIYKHINGMCNILMHRLFTFFTSFMMVVLNKLCNIQ